MSNERKKFSLRKLIYNDKYLIIISVLAAVVIWCATSMNLSPETVKTISASVPVDFSDSAAAQLGIKSFGDEMINVDVTISCKKYLAKDINADDLNITLQTNEVTTKGNIEVPIRVSANDNADFNIVSFYPTVYRAYFDVEDSKVMDIEIKYPDESFIETGYVMGNNLLSESSITVVGPKTYVSRVKNVVANVSFDEMLSKTQTIDIKPIAVDEFGDRVEYVKIVAKNDTITLTVPVLKQTTLDVTSSFIGKPLKVDETKFDVSYSVNRVNAGVLEEAELKNANVGNIDFAQLNVGKNVFSFKTSEIDTFTVLDDIDTIDVTVVVPSSYKKKTFYVDGNNVDITNIPDGYKAEVASLSSFEAVVIGQRDDLATINAEDIRLFVDLSPIKDSFNKGLNKCTITATIENNDSCWVYGTYTTEIRIFND